MKMEAPRIRTLEPGLLEKIVKNLVPAHQKGDPFYVPAFLYTYRKFTTTRQVLDLLFKRYGFFHPNCEEDDQVKNTICSLFAMWLDKYPADFCQSKDLANLNKLMAYVLLHMPCSDLAVHIQHLQTQLVEVEANEASTKCEESLGLGLHKGAAPELKAMDPPVTSLAPLVLESTLPSLARDLGPLQKFVPHVKVEHFESAVEQSEHLLCPVDLQPVVATALVTYQPPGIKAEEVALLSLSADIHLDLPTSCQINLPHLVEEKLAYCGSAQTVPSPSLLEE
ncbi:ral guanine nucleotide dissociation stimulator-like [Perognathus longimembris pacificus]|uniref:ral guanine nucleotide dissociation stimulator-like n=1 Tax=Perognathus longimembris pacificus TaxID=214514 RepID=UPI002019A428|nr:ral guanine nucleotide dissociation stimulator-like [Perognathus longimembris pacificus]